jgi:hypothetical protein
VDALGDAILGAEVTIEVDLGLSDDLEVRSDDDGCERVLLLVGVGTTRVSWSQSGAGNILFHTLQLLGRQVEHKIQGTRSHGCFEGSTRKRRTYGRGEVSEWVSEIGI